MSKSRDGLIKIINDGELSSTYELSTLSDSDLTLYIKRAYIANILSDGKLPPTNSDDFKALMQIMSSLDRQVSEIKNNESNNIKNELDREIKELLIKHPGTLGSAQDVANMVGGYQVDNDILSKTNCTKFNNFVFKMDELTQDHHNIQSCDVQDIVDEYTNKITTVARQQHEISKSATEASSGENSNTDVETPNKKFQNN